MDRLKFKQDIRDFFSSKTNWLGIITIGGAAVGYYSGMMNPLEAYQTATGALMALFVRDAIAGV